MTDKDAAFIEALTQNTARGHVKWEPTARSNELTVSFKGEYNVSVREIDGTYYFVMKNREDREMLSFASEPGNYIEYSTDWWVRRRLSELFDAARRSALSVDRAIDDIMSEFPPA
jgi:hypothetical protein